jgi:superfamily II DNA or RNA helicase
MEVAGYEDPVRYLIESGYLAEPHFQLLNMKPGLTLTEADQASLAEAFEVSDSLLERLGSDPLRNLKIVQAVEGLLQEHSRIIVFAPSVKSAQAISAILNAQGHSAFWVSGETRAVERSQIINSFRSSKATPMVLCNFGVLTTGFDAPRTSAAVIARPTMSLVLYSQMVGRATRGPKAGGNATAVVVTVVDPELAGFGKIEHAFRNWEDVWHAQGN